MSLNLTELQAALAKAAASWQGGMTSVSGLSDAEKRSRLGATPPPGTPSLEDREHAGRVNARGIGAGPKAGAAYPSHFDWRDLGGENYVTPIEDQGSCGSCVAFGTTATVESMVRIMRGDPNYQVDLSEAQLFYCYAAAEGDTCETGWWPDNALDAYKQGIVDAACFPYTPGDQACNLCADAQSRLTMISGWHTTGSTDDMKAWISQTGPVSTCFSVYDDFFAYTGGIYTHVTGNLAGGHCVDVVGYDDDAGCWIAKNSWGTGWGENGFFRIAYGQCGFDTTMWTVEGIVATGWERGVTIAGLWTIDQDRNAWVYANNLGWRKIGDDDDNIFYTMLVQLASAKAAARPVDFFEEQGVIKQVAVW